MTRALNNRNPLNIRRVAGTAWMGQCPVQTDKAFVQFEAIEWGLRAAFCILRTYARRYNIHCVRSIVRRWAPPAENDTARYVRNVCRQTGFGGQQRLAQQDWPRLVRAMALQECGVLLDEETVNRSYELYKRTK